PPPNAAAVKPRAAPEMRPPEAATVNVRWVSSCWPFPTRNCEALWNNRPGEPLNIMALTATCLGSTTWAPANPTELKLPKLLKTRSPACSDAPLSRSSRDTTGPAGARGTAATNRPAETTNVENFEGMGEPPPVRRQFRGLSTKACRRKDRRSFPARDPTG